MEEFLVLGGLVSPVGSAVATGDQILDKATLLRQDEDAIRNRLTAMSARRLETKQCGSEQEREFVPQSNTVSGLTQALSNRRPAIAATIKLIDISKRTPSIKMGVTVCSEFGITHIDQSLRGFLSKAHEKIQQSKNTKQFTVDISTASEDEDLDAEHVLADTLFNVFGNHCPLRSGAWPYAVASKSREEIGADDAGTVVARTLQHDSNVAVESVWHEYHSVVVTGATGAGKSAVCCIIGGESARRSDLFRPARGCTGTTQVRSKRVTIGGSEVVLVDTPGLGDTHGGDALSTMSMSQQLVGEGKTVAHVHVVKHDEDRPGLVGGDILDKYSDILGRALISRLVVVVTHKDSYNVDVTVDSWRVQKIRSSSGEYGSAISVMELDLAEMDWEHATHAKSCELIDELSDVLAMQPVDNQAISEMEKWLADIRDGANQDETERAREEYKTRYNAVFAESMHTLWKGGALKVWCDGSVCLLRVRTGSRLFLNRAVRTMGLLFEGVEKAKEGWKLLRRAKSAPDAIAAIPSNMVAICYERALKEGGLLYDAETRYFKLVEEVSLLEVVVHESREESSANHRSDAKTILRIMSHAS